MSFYGNVFYSYSNAFKYQEYENLTVSSTAPYDSAPSAAESNEADKYTIEPRGRADTIKMKAGNKWLRFYANTEDKQVNRINIYHRLAKKDQGGTYTNLTPEAIATDNYSGAVDLKFGNILTIPQISIDKAGHIVSSEMKNVHIPRPEGAEDIKELKRRIAQLEEYLTGQHGDNGEDIPPGGDMNDQPDPQDWQEMNDGSDAQSAIQEIKDLIATWELKEQGKPYGEYKEAQGIGTTLHKLMVDIGIRTEDTYDVTVDGVTKTYTGYQTVATGNYPSGTIKGDIASLKSSVYIIPYIVESLNLVVDKINTVYNMQIPKIKRPDEI